MADDVHGHHGLLVALAAMATRGALQASRVAAPEEAMPLFVPEPTVPPDKAAPVPDLVTEPPPEGFQTIPIPSDMPLAIPPIDLAGRPFDPRDFAGIGREDGVADGGAGAPAPNVIYKATTGLERFVPAVLAQPKPKYPATLLLAGLAGVVLVEFVIDTIGRVEAGSIRVVESDHQAFEAAALAAVLDAKFRPAHVGPLPVRQLSQQRIRFVAAH